MIYGIDRANPVSALSPPGYRPSSAAPPQQSAATRCSGCALRSACLPFGLSGDDLQRLDAIIRASRTVKRGDALYRTSDVFRNIYAVRTGSFKTVVMHRDGREQVTGFHLAGEALGLDGVYAGRHNCDAVALEDSCVCGIPFHQLERLCREIKTLQQHVHRMMSGEIVRESGLMVLLGTMSAGQRVAAFLLNLSARLKMRGYSAAEFNLRMTREEMGSYLGMKLETVSRVFSKFQKDGLLDTHGRQVHILDFARLANI